MGVSGSGTNMDVLNEAGVQDADILIAVTDSDEINLLTCLIAKKMGDCKTIARVRNPEYGKEVHLFKEDLGLAMIINPEYTAATEMARVLRFPSAIQIDTFVKGRVEILKFKLQKGSPLNDMKLAEIGECANYDELYELVEDKTNGYAATLEGNVSMPVIVDGTEYSVVVNLTKFCNSAYDTATGNGGEPDNYGESPYTIYYGWMQTYGFVPAG